MRFSICSSFIATHRIRVDVHGTLEPMHAHDWRIKAFLKAPGNNMETATEAEEFLAQWVSRYDGNCLNDVAPFDVVNPTAEEVARTLAEQIADSLAEATVERIEVGEAAGFSAIYWPRPAAE